jgi:hypothetical protein
MPTIDGKTELNKDLILVPLTSGENGLQRAGQQCPQSLPGQARVSLDRGPLQEYLREEFLVPDLDRMAPYLWLVRN